MLRQPTIPIQSFNGCGCNGLGGLGEEDACVCNTFKPAVGAVIGALLAGPVAEAVDEGAGGVPAIAKIAVYVVASVAGYGIGRLL
tara:strand:- start:210 stop:464 length:255 start_codon:yes stop_codon:yes gene_type:complete